VLQQLYAYGVVGVIVLAGMYSSLFWQLRKLRQSPVKTMFLCFLCFIVVRGLAESDAFDLLFPMWASLLVSVLAQTENFQADNCHPIVISENSMANSGSDQ